MHCVHSATPEEIKFPTILWELRMMIYPKLQTIYIYLHIFRKPLNPKALCSTGPYVSQNISVYRANIRVGRTLMKSTSQNPNVAEGIANTIII
jgi:hypothetical protein